MNYFIRKKEIRLALSKISNNEGFSVIGSHGVGKTTFVKTLVSTLLRKKKHNIVYVDLIKITSSQDFIRKFFNSIKENISQKSQKKIAELRYILFDKTDRSILDDLETLTEQELNSSIIKLLDFINTLKYPTLLVFDNYKNVSGLFNYSRSKLFEHIKLLNNTQLIVIDEGESIESNENSIFLDKIPKTEYEKVLVKMFNNRGTQIKPKTIRLILKWSQCDLRATQKLCTMLLKNANQRIKPNVVKKTIDKLYLEYEHNYRTVKNLLSPYQWKLLTAIAREGVATQITSNRFISKYELNAPSSVKTGLKSLLEKDMILRKESSYQLSDVILSNWLANE